VLEQLDKATREDLYRFLAELLLRDLEDQQQEASAPVASDLEPAAR
jgi:hypothetical protein